MTAVSLPHSAIVPVSSTVAEGVSGAANQASNMCSRVWSVFVKGCSESGFVKNLVKAFNYTTFWVRHTVSSCPSLNKPQVAGAMEVLKASGEIGKDIKNVLSFVELPEKVTQLAQTTKRFFAKPSLKEAANVGADLGQTVNSVFDGVDLSTRVMPIKPEVMRNLVAVNNVATVFSAGKGTINEIQQVVNSPYFTTNDPEVAAKEKKKLILNAWNIGKLFSYVVVGAMGLAAFAAGVTFAPWAFPAVLTGALVFTFGGYFYDKIVDPKQKLVKAESPVPVAITA